MSLTGLRMHAEQADDSDRILLDKSPSREMANDIDEMNKDKKAGVIVQQREPVGMAGVR